MEKGGATLPLEKGGPSPFEFPNSNIEVYYIHVTIHQNRHSTVKNKHKRIYYDPTEVPLVQVDRSLLFQGFAHFPIKSQSIGGIFLKYHRSNSQSQLAGSSVHLITAGEGGGGIVATGSVSYHNTHLSSV